MHSKEQKYLDWITKNVPSYESAYGKCYEVSTRMQEDFPELKRVSGFYYCIVWGERCHWWLIAEDGSIVDPTVSQFPSLGHGHYEELDNESEMPTGKCLECGSLCYDYETFCCVEHGKSFVDSIKYKDEEEDQEDL